jgi:apolipoprotein N-acyltransferase
LVGLLGYALMLKLSEPAGARPLRSAFFRGWLAGVGYFALGVGWITEPFMVDAAVYGWMAPFALLAMAGGLALFWGLASLAYRALAPRGVWRVLVFAGLLAGAEWLRGHLMTGFPWNLPGESWRAGSAPSQAAALIGVYGLTWLTVAMGAAPAVLFDKASRRVKGATLGLAAAALAGLYLGGAARLQAPAGDQGVRLRVVQADIDQKTKWRPENLDAIVQDYLRLSRTPAATPPDVIVWPEGALPAVIDELLAPGSPYVPRFAALLAPGQVLAMGANRVKPGADGGWDYFNSLVAFEQVGGDLKLVGLYDKHRLVPFGEFLPLGETATRLGVRSLVHMPEDFSFGPKPRPQALGRLPLAQPLICYEALFPGAVRDAARRGGARPSWILNISNDAWFGQASGPLQHLNLASYRAIEEGLPIVRATPTGVSAVIDAHGRILPGKSLGLGEAGVIDAVLPAALPPTPYARFGDLAFVLLLLVSALALAARRRPVTTNYKR